MKSLKSEHRKIVDELVSEHILARKTVSELLKAKDRYLQGEAEALQIVYERLHMLIEL